MNALIRRAIIALCAVSIFVLPTTAQAEVIRNFDTTILLTENNQAIIREHIQYDFEGVTDRHGIYRDIPRMYSTTGLCDDAAVVNGEECRVDVLHDIRILSVESTDGVEQPFSLDDSTSETVRIKIGDPDVTVSGVKDYVIAYTFAVPVVQDTATGAPFFAWNVTGNNWEVPIDKASVNVALPRAGVVTSQVCYTGLEGSKEMDCVNQQTEKGFFSTTNNPFPVGGGLTVSAALQDGVIAPGALLDTRIDRTSCFLWDCDFAPELTIQPGSGKGAPDPIIVQTTGDSIVALPAGLYHLTAKEYGYESVKDVSRTLDPGQRFVWNVQFKKSPLWVFLALYLPLIATVLYLVFVLFLWRRYGRDPRLSHIVVTEFTPPKDLTPIEAGFVIKSMVQNIHISAQIIDLAIRGYLVIEQTEQKGVMKYMMAGKYDYAYTANVEQITTDWNTTKLTDAERSILTGIFGVNGVEYPHVTFLDVKKTFHIQTAAIHKAVARSILEKELISRSPKLLIGLCAVLAFAWIAFSIGGVGVFDSLLFAVLGIPAGVVGFVMALLMGQRTVKGTKMLRYLQGYKKYLMVAEKDRIAFFNDPKEYQRVFEEVLPYAMILGVEQQWCAQFEGLITQPPSWYHGNMTNGFLIGSLANDLSSLSSAMSASASAPSSSGGGSGGGFGGGGGGSW